MIIIVYLMTSLGTGRLLFNFAEVTASFAISCKTNLTSLGLATPAFQFFTEVTLNFLASLVIGMVTTKFLILMFTIRPSIDGLYRDDTM